jgi:hypothetical protein
MELSGMSDINDLLNRLSKVKQTGAGKWVACCPAHEDRSPSLSIRQADDRILIYCFAGCGADDVVGSVGMSLSDLMPESVGYNHQPTPTVLTASTKAELFDVMVGETAIFMVATRQIAMGVPFSEVDTKRIRLAEIRLDKVIALADANGSYIPPTIYSDLTPTEIEQETAAIESHAVQLNDNSRAISTEERRRVAIAKSRLRRHYSYDEDAA